MSLIPDLSAVPEQAPVAEGEYDLRITSAKEVTSSGGRKGVLFICDIVGEDNATTLFHRLWFPFDSEDDAKKQTMWRMIKEFVVALTGESKEMEVADFIGLEFSAILSYDDDPEFGARNELKRVT